jgi:exo-beta-1,3-glucanase (GH17 family)
MSKANRFKSIDDIADEIIDGSLGAYSAETQAGFNIGIETLRDNFKNQLTANELIYKIDAVRAALMRKI